MRKVLLRWKVESLSGLEEIGRLLEIAKRIEVIGHLSLGEDGVTQLVELNLQPGHEITEISDLKSFELLEKN